MDYLFLLCELAVGFAGFTAVVAAFQADGGTDQQTLNKVRLQQMLELSLFAVGAGLLPFLLVSFGLANTSAFRVAAAVMLPAFMTLMFLQLRRGFDPRVQQAPGYSIRVVWLLIALGVICIVAWVLAGTGLAKSEASYQLGATALLVVAGISFFRTATSALRPFR